MNDKEPVIGNAREVSVEKIYMIDVLLSGQDFTILVARHTAENGIKCLIGQDVLRAFEPTSNFYHAISEAIKKCDENSS